MRISYINDDAILQNIMESQYEQTKNYVAYNSGIIPVRSGTLQNSISVGKKGNIFVDFFKKGPDGKTAAYSTLGLGFNSTDARVKQAFQLYAAKSAQNFVRPMLPRKTGNLQDNAFKLVMGESPSGLPSYGITIDLSIAPYAQYPNVKRIIDSQWPSMQTKFQKQLEITLQNQQSGLWGNTSDFTRVNNQDLGNGLVVEGLRYSGGQLQRQEQLDGSKPWTMGQLVSGTMI
jgi:hypothetical protein